MSNNIIKLLTLLINSRECLDRAQNNLDKFLAENDLEFSDSMKLAISAALNSVDMLGDYKSPAQCIKEISEGIHICDMADESYYRVQKG